MALTTRQLARTVKEAFVWYYFFPVVSEVGENWCEVFHSSGGEDIIKQCDILVARMRRPEECLDTVLRDLEEVRASILRLAGTAPPSIQGVVEESYRGAIAYWHFRLGSLDAADAELVLALNAVEQALSSDKFLLTYALKNIQLITNRGRIARRQRNFALMAMHLDTCERMLSGDIPIHGRGTSAIFMDDVCSYYRNIEPATDLDAEALVLLSDPKLISMSFRHAIYSVWKSLHIPNDY